MLEDLKKRVCRANIFLQKEQLVSLTWGNVSAINEERTLFVIKPSGVEYDKLSYEDMVVVDLNGNTLEGKYKPSSDMLTHLELYKAFDSIGGICHTHSVFATSFAQAKRPIPCFGTTHADYFYSDVPCIRNLSEEEIEKGYERYTGLVIVEEFLKANIDPLATPACICANHGVFTWAADPAKAVENALVLEKVAEMAYRTLVINPKAKEAPKVLQDKHYFRKHGPNSYYGQKD